MGAGLLAVKTGFILFIKDDQFSLQINTLEREREKEEKKGRKRREKRRKEEKKGGKRKEEGQDSCDEESFWRIKC
jgi:hypothetical protein